ncbi:MAG: hypothetical protein IKI77_01355 [Oscillospiraceae bacterium]|nr:hypothetical protein [Oscillospiraceae bacterium]
MGKNVNRLLSGAMAVLMLGELVVQNSDPLVWSALKVSAETEAVVSEAEKADAEKTEASAEEPESGEKAAEYEDLTVSANKTLTGKTEVGNLTLTGGELNLNGYSLIVHGDVTINGGAVRMNKGELFCENFTMQNQYASFYMTNVNDHLVVNGNFTYTSGNMHDTFMTAGTIEVKGDFASTGGSFRPTGEHIVILNGKQKQTVTQSGMSSRFHTLDIENTAEEGVCSNATLFADIITGNLAQLHIGGSGEGGFVLEEDAALDSFYLVGGDLDLNGYTLTIKGDLTQAGGRVIPNGGTLNIGGDYRIATAKQTDDTVTYEYSTGYLMMTNEEDRVNVAGDFVTYSTQDHRSCMTAGILTIGGDFEQKRPNAYNNFYATGTHKTVFDGDKAHTVSFEETWGTAYCAFHDLDISGEEITIPLQAYVNGTLLGTECKVTGMIDLFDAGVTGAQFDGNLRFRKDYTLTEDLTVNGNLDVNGNLNLDGHKLTVSGNVNNYSNINLNGGTLDCGGNYVNAYYYGSLTMKNEKDLLKVKGNYTHDGYYGSTLTNGRIMVGGNCTIGSSFNASEAHALILNGEAAQTLNVTSTGLQINKLVIENTGKEGVTVASVINVNEIQNAKNSKVQFAGGGQLGFKLTEDKTIEGDFDLAHGDLDLNGHKLTITGNLTQAGGRVIPNGGTLTVNGDYRIAAAKKTDDGVVYEQSTGWLVMTNEKDRVTVKGDFATYSTQDHSSCMTAGILSIGGNFEQKRTSSYNNFYATGTHKTVFGGDKAHTVSFEESWGSAYCVFRDLDISGEEITIPLQAYMTGTLTHKDGTIKGCLDLCGTTAGGTVNGSLRFRNDCTLTADLTVKGNLDINGNLNLDGHTLTVTGNVTNSSNLNLNGGTLDCGGNYVNAYYYGSLTMKNEKDLLKVKGDYTHDGYYGSTLTNGRIMVGGNCTIGSSFNASEAHELILNGTAAQTLNVTSTGLQINKLILENTGAEGITIASAINVNALENTNGCKVNFAGDGEIGFRLTSDRTIEGDFDLAAGTLDLNGHKLTITGSLIQSGGTVNPNGGTLNIGGDYKIVTRQKTDDNVTDTVSTGLLIMKNEKDRVNVSGDFVTYSSQDHNGSLTAGVLTIGGNFLQRRTNSYNNFYAAGSHKTVFDGDKAHTIDFDESWNSAYCVFRNLDLDGETVSIPHQLFVTGDLQGENASVSGYVTISSLKQIQGAKFGGNISLTNTGIGEEVQLTQDMELGSLSCHNLFLKGHKLSVNAITINGTVYPEGGMLEARSNLTLNTYANLSMQDPMDYIWIGGNFRTDSRNANDGMLKAGTIEIKGDFEQTYDTTFVTEDDCLVIMNGTNALNGRVLIQTIKFVNPEKSGFRNLQITKPLTEYRFLNGAGKTADPTLFYTNLQENIIDQEPPAKVTGAAVTASQTTSVSLVWNAAKDNIGVMGYEIYRDSKKIFTTAKTEFTDAGLAPETGYVYEIYAFDACRNYSDASEKITAVTLKDTEAPTAPEDLRLLSKTGSSVTLAWNVSKDNVATTGYYIYCDGKKVAEEKDGLYHKVTGLETDKSYVFTVCAVDAAGNVSKHSGSVSAAPQKPKFDSVLPKEHAELGGKTQDITVRFANLGNSSDVRVDLEYKSADQTDKEYQPAAGYQVSRNAAAGFVTVVYNWALSGLKGDYHLRITLTDSEGNAASTVTEYFVDSSAPAAPSWLKAATKDGAMSCSGIFPSA